MVQIHKPSRRAPWLLKHPLLLQPRYAELRALLDSFSKAFPDGRTKAEPDFGFFQQDQPWSRIILACPCTVPFLEAVASRPPSSTFALATELFSPCLAIPVPRTLCRMMPDNAPKHLISDMIIFAAY